MKMKLKLKTEFPIRKTVKHFHLKSIERWTGKIKTKIASNAQNRKTDSSRLNRNNQQQKVTMYENSQLNPIQILTGLRKVE